MLGFGLGITHCGIAGGVSDAADGSVSAVEMLAGEDRGLAIDFTDGDNGSAYVIDASEAELLLDGYQGLAIDFTDGANGSAFVRS